MSTLDQISHNVHYVKDRNCDHRRLGPRRTWNLARAMRRPVREHERPEISHWCNAYWELPAPRRCSCCETLPAFSAGAVTLPVRRRGDLSAVDRSWRHRLDRLPRTPLHAGHNAALWMTSTTSNPWTGSLACRPPAGACSRNGRRLRNACIDRAVRAACRRRPASMTGIGASGSRLHRRTQQGRYAPGVSPLRGHPALHRDQEPRGRNRITSGRGCAAARRRSACDRGTHGSFQPGRGCCRLRRLHGAAWRRAPGRRRCRLP